jgi:PmbA protein
MIRMRPHSGSIRATFGRHAPSRHTQGHRNGMTVFSISDDRLRELAKDALGHARTLGASDASCEVSESTGLSVTVRKRKVETIEHTRDKGLGVTVYLGQRRGHASTSDFSTAAVRQAVEAAHNIARFTAEDDAAGLPDEDTFERRPRDVDLFHPWLLDTEEAIRLAQRCEAAAFDVSPRIVNSEGANVYTSSGHFVLANTRDFMAGYPYSRHSISVSPIARDGSGMQRDDWYSSSRLHAELASPEAIGDYAAQRALARLGARKLGTRQCPVLFEAPLACGLLGNFVQAASGGALYRKSTFLVDSLGKPVFAPHVTIDEDPYLPRGPGSSPFDEEGVRGLCRQVVSKGRLEGYFLSTYSARKLGMKSTGNAGGSYNITLRSSNTDEEDDFEVMLRRLGTGLLVTELIGQGVNYVTGDYSRGASGFWVEGGQIRFPVEEITIAGNLRQMFADIAAVGTDEVVRGSKITGSLLVEGMTVAGS